MIFNGPSSPFSTRHAWWDTFREGICFSEYLWVPTMCRGRPIIQGALEEQLLDVRFSLGSVLPHPIFCNYNSPVTMPTQSTPQASLHHTARGQSSQQSSPPELRPPCSRLWVNVVSTAFQRSFSHPISFQLLPLLTTLSGWTGNWSFLNRVLTV